jgi:hypothetical protein
MLISGVILVALTYNAFAANLTISAVVYAPPITSPATIIKPLNNAHFLSSPIEVLGSCPNNSHVELIRNGLFSGAASCGPSDTTYQIFTDLNTGSNELYVRVFNTTDNEGPQSSRITVFFDKTIINNNTGKSAQTATNLSIITTSPVSLITTSGTNITWEIAPQGGMPPYASTINWQDGKQDIYARANNSKFKISHTYQLATSGRKNFNIKIKIVDSLGSVADLQLTATIVKNSDAADGAGSHNMSGYALFTSINGVEHWVWPFWPVYTALVLMTLSFWLGEREEYHMLVKTIKTAKNTHAAKQRK